MTASDALVTGLNVRTKKRLTKEVVMHTSNRYIKQRGSERRSRSRIKNAIYRNVLVSTDRLGFIIMILRYNGTSIYCLEPTKENFYPTEFERAENNLKPIQVHI